MVAANVGSKYPWLKSEEQEDACSSSSDEEMEEETLELDKTPKSSDASTSRSKVNEGNNLKPTDAAGMDEEEDHESDDDNPRPGAFRITTTETSALVTHHSVDVELAEERDLESDGENLRPVVSVITATETSAHVTHHSVDVELAEKRDLESDGENLRPGVFDIMATETSAPDVFTNVWHYKLRPLQLNFHAVDRWMKDDLTLRVEPLGGKFGP